MDKQLTQSFWIFIAFVVFIPMGDKFGNSFNQMHAGIIHPASLFFILIVGMILHASAHKQSTPDDKLDKALKIFEAFKGSGDLQALTSSKNTYVQSILALVRENASEEDLALSIQKITLELMNDLQKRKNDYEYGATVMPIVGMIGTIAGLLAMFAMPNEIEDFDSKFKGLSVALATTLYASAGTILFFKPLANAIDTQILDLEKDASKLELEVRRFLFKVDLGELETIMSTE